MLQSLFIAENLDVYSRKNRDVNTENIYSIKTYIPDFLKTQTDTEN